MKLLFFVIGLTAESLGFWYSLALWVVAFRLFQFHQE